MFGRRRHVARAMTPPVSPPPESRSTQAQLTQAQLYEVIHESIAGLIGPTGQWSVVRRTDTDTDAIFHGILTDSVTLQVVSAVSAAQAKCQAVPTEPAALTWQPAPITVWADLRKPVTGEIPQIGADAGHVLVA